MDIILLEAAAKGDYMMIEKLVATGESRINFRDPNNGYTALHFACANGHLECVSILLQLGADPSASTGSSAFGYLTPLHIASQAGFDDIVSLLLHHSSDVTEPDSNNNTATNVAATMAVSLRNEIEANRRRDCEVVLRVQDDPADLFKHFVPPKNIQSNVEIEKDLIVSIECGGSSRVQSSFGLAVSQRGTLWTWGINDKGQAFRGVDITTNFKKWRRSEVLRTHHHRVDAISCGTEHSLAIISTGHIVGCGSSYNGQLGIGDAPAKVREPIPIDLTMRAASVACGAFHSAIILENGVTLVFGLNRSGQLGINNTVDKLAPVEVPIFLQNNILMKRVVCGKSHTLWIDTNHNLWAAGRGICTGLGSGDTNELLAQMIPNFKAINIAAGEAHSMAIEDTKERQLFTWGFGGYGCLGHGDRSDKKVPRHVTMFADKKVARRSSLVNIAAGAKHSIVLTNYCEVYVFGENNFGQLGRGDRKPMLLPKLLTSLHQYLPAKPILISASGFHSLIAL